MFAMSIMAKNTAIAIAVATRSKTRACMTSPLHFPERDTNIRFSSSVLRPLVAGGATP